MLKWSDFDSDALCKFGSQVHSSGLCGLWLRQALMAAQALPEWERIVLTVDSGASDTVVPPHVAKNLPLLPSAKVGIEYEVANGGVVANLGERRGEIKTRDGGPCFLMSFQVVEVHKPLLAVSKLVECGHKVVFDKDEPHILMAGSLEKIPMTCVGGTYEIEVFIRNPGFTRPHSS